MTPRKRVYDLIIAFSELIKQNNDFHLHIAGGQHPAYGDYYAAIEHIVNKLNLRDRVTFYGNVTENWNWYHNIDIFISNGYSEGLQVAPMEAMASGCYCLAHRWDGAEELLPEENLYYTNNELLEKILDYCDRPAAEKQMEREHMRDIASNKFDINQTLFHIRGVLEDVSLSYMSKDGTGN